MTVMSVLYGAAVGVCRSLYGWTGKENEPFDFVKFAKTAILGAIVGGAAASFGMTFEAAHAGMETLGLLTLIDYGATAALNRVGVIIWKFLKG